MGQKEQMAFTTDVTDKDELEAIQMGWRARRKWEFLKKLNHDD